MRSPRRFLVFIPLLTVSVALVVAQPAAAKDTGDEAYATKFDYVIAVSGNVAVQAKLQNYQGPTTKFRRVSEGAVRTALKRLDRVSVTPPTTQAS